MELDPEVFVQQEFKPGVGYPQLSAVIECVDAAHGLGLMLLLMVVVPVQATLLRIWGGADFVMLGMLAGHDEGKGKIVKVNGEKYIEFYGSSSEVANKNIMVDFQIIEVVKGESKSKYRGKINNTILNILGGVRSSCTYVGALNN